MLMASSSRIAVTLMQAWPSLHLVVLRQRQEFRKLRSTDRITPSYLTMPMHGLCLRLSGMGVA